MPISNFRKCFKKKIKFWKKYKQIYQNNIKIDLQGPKLIKKIEKLFK